MPSNSEGLIKITKIDIILQLNKEQINMTKLQEFNKKQLKNDLPNLRPGYVVRVHQTVKESGKERIQIFEGIIIAKKHGQGINGTITVRKMSGSIGVERTLPIHSPVIKKIEIVKENKTRRAKLFYLRNLGDKKVKMKEKKKRVVPETVEEPAQTAN